VKLTQRSNRECAVRDDNAHGFQALSEDCELIYLHTAAHHPDAQGALNVTDPRLGIVWPLPIVDLSERDRNHPFIKSGFQKIVL